MLKEKDDDPYGLDGPDLPRWPGAPWLDGPLVMGRLDLLDRVRVRRAAFAGEQVGLWEVTIASGRVQAVRRVDSSGDPELDAMVEALYADAEMPPDARFTGRVRLHPPGTGTWPGHVRGPLLVDRRAMTRALPYPRAQVVELDLRVDKGLVRRVRVAASSGEPELDEACVALFRGAELVEWSTGWITARVEASDPDW